MGTTQFLGVLPARQDGPPWRLGYSSPFCRNPGDGVPGGMDKHSFSERDICTKFITPALRQAGWDEMLQIREEVGFTKGRIIVRGKLVTLGHAKRH